MKRLRLVFLQSGPEIFYTTNENQKTKNYFFLVVFDINHIGENTECSITVEKGTNLLGGIQRDSLLMAVKSILESGEKDKGVPDLWDGKTAERIVKIILSRAIS